MIKMLPICLLAFLVAVSALYAVRADTHYVDKANAAPVPPFNNGWSSAATNIQDALDWAESNDVVLVTNGVYDTGTRIDGLWGVNVMSNRVVVSNAVIVRAASTNPAHTVIVGAPDMRYGFPSIGDDAVRGVYLGAGAQLIGFTVSNGYSRSNTYAAGYGGGVNAGTAGVISNCVLINNYAYNGGGMGGGTAFNSRISFNTAYDGGGVRSTVAFDCLIATNLATHYGGGAYRGSAYRCAVVSNSAVRGGGAYDMTLVQECDILTNVASQIGGGCYRGTYVKCNIIGNRASGGNSCGGAYECTLDRCVVGLNWGNTCGGIERGFARNCLVVGNSANAGGAGVHNASMENCTVVSNSCGAAGGGVGLGGGFTNCIIYYNSPRDFINTTFGVDYCCTSATNTFTNSVSNIHNVTNNPMFVCANDGNYRLSRGSPCFNSGTNMDWMVSTPDLDGNSRICNGIVEMGAYEYYRPKGTVITIYGQ